MLANKVRDIVVEATQQHLMVAERALISQQVVVEHQIFDKVEALLATAWWSLAVAVAEQMMSLVAMPASQPE